MLSIAVLIALMTLCFSIANSKNLAIWLNETMANLFIEIMGAILTGLFINEILILRERQKYDRLQKVALNKIHAPLKKFLTLIWEMKKGSMSTPPTIPHSYREAFNLLEQPNSISCLDFFTLSGTGDGTRTFDWFEWAPHAAKQFKDETDKVIDTYFPYLDSKFIESIETFNNCDFMRSLLNVGVARQAVEKLVGTKKHYAHFAMFNDEVKEGLEYLLATLDRYNQMANQKIEFEAQNMSDQSSPTFGSGRMPIHLFPLGYPHVLLKMTTEERHAWSRGS